MINSLPTNQISPEKAPLDWKTPLSGEKPLWFHRFCLYRDLGPKRSLRAALAKEQAQFTLLDTEQHASESHDEPEEKKVVHVPGSWKQASVSFCWQERCKAFDLAIIQTISQDQLQHAGKSLANQFARIEQLSRIADMVWRYISLERNRRTLTHKECIAYIRLLRDLVKDVKQEMQGIDDQTLLQSIEWFTSACYFDANWTPEKNPFPANTPDRTQEKTPDFFHSVVDAILKVKIEAYETI